MYFHKRKCFKIKNLSNLYWAHSLMDRITGFGPVDVGSIPTEPFCYITILSSINLNIHFVF